MSTKPNGRIDVFGEFVASKLRDPEIDNVDGLLNGHWKAPSLRLLQAELSGLSPSQKALVRRAVAQTVDSAIHDFLFAVQEQSDSDGRIQVMVDGEDVARDSDGLQGEPEGNKGWYARFSKHGPPPDEA